MATPCKKLLLVLVSAVMVFFGCAQKPSGGRSTGVKTGAREQKKAVVSYESEIKPLLKKSCVSCHSGSQEPNLSTYANVKKAAKSLHESVKEGVMPPAKKDRWTAKQVELVKLWIAGGYLINAPVKIKPKDDKTDDDKEDDSKDESEDDKPEIEVKPKVTYDLNVKKIVNSYCVMCHGVGGNLPELDTKEKVIAAGDAVLDSVQADRMPETGPLRAADKALIKSWIADGKL